MQIKSPEKMTYWEMFLALSPDKRKQLREWWAFPLNRKNYPKRDMVASLLCTLYVREWREFMEGAAR